MATFEHFKFDFPPKDRPDTSAWERLDQFGLQWNCDGDDPTIVYGLLNKEPMTKEHFDELCDLILQRIRLIHEFEDLYLDRACKENELDVIKEKIGSKNKEWDVINSKLFKNGWRDD